MKYVRVYLRHTGTVNRDDYIVNGHRANRRSLRQAGDQVEDEWVIRFESKKICYAVHRNGDESLIIHPSLVMPETT